MTKKTISKIALALILTTTSIYFFAPWRFALYFLKPLPETLQELVQEASEQNIDGIIVYVDRKGETEQIYAKGWHDRDNKIPAKPNALFKIGSIRKLYISAALAKLVASEELSLEGTLISYLPEIGKHFQYSDKITLRMMVQHTSGLPNYTDQAGFDWGKSMTFDESLSLVRGVEANFVPGSDYSYSNTNYMLLKRIMDQALGYDTNLFIKESILDPMELKYTYFSVNDVDQDRMMSGYHIGYPNDFKALDQGFVASAKDVGNFVRALNEGSFFTDTEMNIYQNLYEFEHSGWVLGYQSNTKYLKEKDTVVVQFINTTGNDTVMLTKIIINKIKDII